MTQKNTDLIESIHNNKYKFITHKISLFYPSFPDTTKFVSCESDENKVSICSNVIVDCSDNFTKKEKKVIDEYNIKNIEDLLRNEHISSHDKHRSLECLQFVRERYNLMGIEPINGNNTIQLGKYAIYIRVLPNRNIKYIKIN